MKRHNKRWSKEEDEYLILHYSSITFPIMAKTLERSVKAVEARVTALGLGRAGEYLGKFTLAEISRAFGKSNSYIQRAWVEKWGFKVPKKILTKSKKIYQVDSEYLWKFCEKNKHRIDFTKLEKYSLGPEPSWVDEERKKKDKKIKHEIKPWSKKEESILQIYHYKSNSELAEMLNRSVDSIRNRRSKLNLKHKVVKLAWTYKETEMAISLRNKGFTYKQIAEELGRTTGGVVQKFKHLKMEGNYEQSSITG